MHILYATTDGQSRQIALRISQKLAGYGIKTTPKDLAAEPPSLSGLKPNEPVVVVAALRYGFHLPEADKFIKAFQKAHLPNPLILLSVNLVARKPGKRTAKGNPYLRRWLKRRKVTPVLAEAIAGRLDYPRYNWFDRLMIRLIMTFTGGPTDPATTVEFTDWDQVDGIAERIGKIGK
ncbi:MAG: menaquinone-dependent protoporphyrinogen IX dehydrogenase [Alphaproteobacteria bacterium]|nr:menaquinone-dependent protoporphyrinogen IX dehydrogenase [Alphaproteobacteria bacterium]